MVTAAAEVDESADAWRIKAWASQGERTPLAARVSID